MLKAITCNIYYNSAVVQEHPSYVDGAKVRHGEGKDYPVLPPDEKNLKFQSLNCCCIP